MAQLIDVIARRKKFDAGKARTLDPVLKPEASDETIFRDPGIPEKRTRA